MEDVQQHMMKERAHENIDKARVITDFKGTAAAAMLRQRLIDNYKMYVQLAINESPTYRHACKSIEDLLAFMQETIDVGKTAERILSDIERGSTDEDF